jgi:SOS response regulatory protein OraA/RecX
LSRRDCCRRSRPSRRRRRRSRLSKPEEVALRALRAADRSRAELDARLERNGIDAETRRETLDRLERLGYLDDARTAATRAERLAGRGYGDAYIRADLEGRELPSDAAMSSLEPEAVRASRFADRGPAWLSRRGFAMVAEDTIGYSPRF